MQESFKKDECTWHGILLLALNWGVHAYVVNVFTPGAVGKKSSTMQKLRKLMHREMTPIVSPIVRQIVYVQGTHFTPTVQYASITLSSLFEANDASTMSQNRNT